MTVIPLAVPNATMLPVGAGKGRLRAADIEAMWPSLEQLPFPVLRIDPRYAVLRANPAARATYGSHSAPCYKLCHGHDQPCEHEGEECLMRLAGRTGEAVSADEAHPTPRGIELFKIAVIPIAEGGILRFDVPLSEGVTRDETGVLRRGFATRVVHRHLAALGEQERSCAYILADLDQLKSINDCHGHEAGDRAIRAVAQAIRESVRITDIACRWGGDEFCVFLPDTDAAAAHRIAQRLLERTREIPLDPALPAAQVSVSIGVHVASTRTPFAEAIAVADRALYRAKHAGRGRIATAL